jgi:hypothetical protein
MLTVIDEIERKGFLTGYESHSVFAPIAVMLNYQISFLMGLEMNMLKALTDRIWRTPFSNLCDSWSTTAVILAEEESNKQILRSKLGSQKQYDGDRASSLLATSLRLISAPSQRLPKYSSFLQVCGPIDNSRIYKY